MENFIPTALSRLSSVNRTLATFCGDQHVRISSPSKAIGAQRSNVRTIAREGKDREYVKQIVDALCGNQQPNAAIVQLARVKGLGLRQAVLPDQPRLQREAGQLAKSIFRTAPKTVDLGHLLLAGPL
jgi:hypothetical protein